MSNIAFAGHLYSYSKACILKRSRYFPVTLKHQAHGANDLTFLFTTLRCVQVRIYTLSMSVRAFRCVLVKVRVYIFR